MKFVETEIGIRLNNHANGVQGRYCALMGLSEVELKSVRPFFDIYSQEGNRLQADFRNEAQLEKVLMDVSYRAFPRAVELRPFRDAELIMMIQRLVRDEVEAIKFEYSGAGDNFTFANAQDSERGSDIVRVAHDRYSYFLNVLKEISELIEQYGHRLQEWCGLKDIAGVATNVQLLDEVLRHLVMEPDLSDTIHRSGKDATDLGLTVHLDAAFMEATGLKLSEVKSHCHLPGNAASEFLQSSGFQRYAQEALVVAQLIEYAEKVRTVDAPHYGIHPSVLPPDEKGLRFHFTKFHHPFLLRNGQGGSSGVSFPPSTYTETDGGEALVQHLLDKAVFAEVAQTADDFSQRKVTKLRWAEGITKSEVEDALDQLPTTQGADCALRLELLEHYRQGASEHFGDFSLGEEDPEAGERVTVVVLPSPNMAGKSTALKTLGLLLHAGLMGRTIPAEGGEMTVPDQIFHNFNVEDNVAEQRSTFKAQLENIRDFLDNATIHSLGLFDELFNGTSSDYQLALAWAFLEKCTDQALRVMISTHNRDLEFFSDPDGYEHIRGSHGRPTDAIKPRGARGAKTLSIGPDRQFKAGSERDSEALAIARDVLSPAHDELLHRAEAILAHVRSPSSVR